MVPQMCEGRLTLEMGHHLRFYRSFVTMGRSTLAVFVVVVIAAVEIVGAFVLVRTAMLSSVSMKLSQSYPGACETNILVSCDQVSHIARGVLV